MMGLEVDLAEHTSQQFIFKLDFMLGTLSPDFSLVVRRADTVPEVGFKFPLKLLLGLQTPLGF